MVSGPGPVGQPADESDGQPAGQPAGESAEQPAERTWRAPGRVNLIGEHTDYNDGFCLPLAIPQGCTATVFSLAEPVLEVVSAQREAPIELALDELRPGALTGTDEWAGYPAGVVWALIQRGHRLPGLSISLDGDVPAGAGLSSSAALECSVASALNDQFGLDLDRSELVAVARQAENDFVGAPTGGMDQLASIFGERDRVLLCDLRTLAVEPLPFDLADVQRRRIQLPIGCEQHAARLDRGERVVDIVVCQVVAMTIVVCKV